jgi:hypothetical protein
MEPTNLNMLFQSLIINFAHLVNIEPQTKEQFLNNIKKTYSLDNPKNLMFYKSTEQSEFKTIQLSRDRNSLLFNENI